MGDIRNGIKREEDATKGLLAGLAGTAFAVAATVANTALTNARIQNKEAKIKELSKGFGRFTNSEEIDTLKRQNASLREKMNKDSK